jgi:hypothetical protein
MVHQYVERETRLMLRVLIDDHRHHPRMQHRPSVSREFVPDEHQMPPVRERSRHAAVRRPGV